MHNDTQRQTDLAQQQVDQQQTIAGRLRALPVETAQPYDWVEFRRRANALRISHSSERKYAGIAAVVAVVVLVAGVAAWSQFSRSHSLSDEVTSVGGEIAGWAPEPGVLVATPELAYARTNATERWLASLPREPAVVRVGTRAAVAGLEDRIAELDDILSTARVEGVQPAHLTALQEQRAQLVNSLAQVRYAEALVYESR
jgi:hypothetical protein